MSNQAVFVVSKENLHNIILHARKRYRTSGEWGFESPDHILNVLVNLKERIPGKVDCSRVAQCLHELHTPKMIGHGNQGLVAVVQRLRRCRERLVLKKEWVTA